MVVEEVHDEDEWTAFLKGMTIERFRSQPDNTARRAAEKLLEQLNDWSPEQQARHRQVLYEAVYGLPLPKTLD